MNLMDYLKNDLELDSIVEQQDSPDRHAHYFDTIDKDRNEIEIKVVHESQDIYMRMQGREDWNFIGQIELSVQSA